VVHHGALLPNLPLAPGEHLDSSQLDHGRGELGLPRLPHGGVEGDEPRCPGAVEQRLVGAQRHLARQHVPVVLVVEAGRRPQVESHRGAVVHVVGRRRAPPLQVRRVRGVDGRVRPPGLAAEVVQPLRERRAVGPPDTVRTGERDHLVGGQPLAPEVVDELAHRKVREGDVVEHLVHDGRAAVAAAGGDAVVDAAGEVRAVARREGEDVGAGDGARAVRLHDGLRLVDHLEPAQAREVRRRDLLRLVPGRRVDQDRRVTSLPRQQVSIIGSHA
jgi:hypothetical protein